MIKTKRTLLIPGYQTLALDNSTYARSHNNLIEQVIALSRDLIIFTKNCLSLVRPYPVRNRKVHDFLDCKQATSYNDSFKKIVEWYV